MAAQRLLVADDSLTIQKVIRLALSQDEYEIQTVSDGKDALQQISLFQPKIVLIDVSLPGRSAFEVKRAVNASNDLRPVRFILMSSAFEKIDEPQAQEVGFHGRITKPFDPTQLRSVLNQVIVDMPTQETATLHDDTFPIMIQEPWEKSENNLITNELEDPFPDLSPPPLSQVNSTDTEIKKLTEATLQMNESEDFQWNINENARKFLGPEVLGEPQFSDLRTVEPTLPPPPSLSDLDGVTLKIDAPLHRITPPPFPPLNATASADPDVMALSTGQMEELLKKQLQDTLEKMARKILPDIAERVIKEEIHKLLQEKH